MPVLINLLGFGWCWLALVLAAFHDLVWAALLLLGLWMALHLFYSRTRSADLRLILAAVMLGPLTDVALLLGGWIEYAAHEGETPYPPIWIPALWANFALVLNHSLAWLKQRWLLAALLGALAGPLCYLAGQSLGAVSLKPSFGLPLLLVALAWAVIWPALQLFTVPRPPTRRVAGHPAA